MFSKEALIFSHFLIASCLQAVAILPPLCLVSPLGCDLYLRQEDGELVVGIAQHLGSIGKGRFSGNMVMISVSGYYMVITDCNHVYVCEQEGVEREREKEKERWRKETQKGRQGERVLGGEREREILEGWERLLPTSSGDGVVGGRC